MAQKWLSQDRPKPVQNGRVCVCVCLCIIHTHTHTHTQGISQKRVFYAWAPVFLCCVGWVSIIVAPVYFLPTWLGTPVFFKRNCELLVRRFLNVPRGHKTQGLYVLLSAHSRFAWFAGGRVFATQGVQLDSATLCNFCAIWMTEWTDRAKIHSLWLNKTWQPRWVFTNDKAGYCVHPPVYYKNGWQHTEYTSSAVMPFVHNPLVGDTVELFCWLTPG